MAGGLLYGGGVQQLVAQTVAVLLTIAISGTGTLVIGRAIHKTIGFRVAHEHEVTGVDLTQHAESAYEFGLTAHGHFRQQQAHLSSLIKGGRKESEQAKEDSFA